MKTLGKVTFDFESDSVKIGNKWLKGVNVTNSNHVKIVTSRKLPPRSENIIHITCSTNLPIIPLDYEHCGNHGIHAARCRVIPDIISDCMIKVVNTNEYKVRVNNRQLCAKFIPTASSINFANGRLSSDISEIVRVDETNINYGDGLSSAEKENIAELLRGYSDIFADNTKEPNRTNLVKHRILTGKNLPTKQKQRWIPRVWERWIRK